MSANTAEKLTSIDYEVESYFQQHLRRVEDLAPSDAAVTGEITSRGGEIEVMIRVASPLWQSTCVKTAANPYIAIDMAIGEITAQIFERKDSIDWSMQ